MRSRRGAALIWITRADPGPLAGRGAWLTWIKHLGRRCAYAARPRGSGGRTPRRIRMFKYVLVPATGAASDETVFETALLAARPFAAHLEFLHVRVDVTEVVISMSTGGLGGGGAVQGVVDKLEAESKLIEGRAWQAVEAFCD